MSQDDLEDIREEIKKSMNTRLGEDFKNVIEEITTKLFTEKSHFLMEITQNAEDAIRKKGIEDGIIKFHLSKERIKIEHNGLPFTYKDVDSICGVRSKKDPSEEFIGYMGIGFKSVFSITNKAQIYSGDYHFKFDENQCPEEYPWFITPLEAKPPERLDEDMTTFIFPFRNDEGIYQTTKDELEKFGVPLLMFLKGINKINIHYENENERTILEKFEADGDIERINKNGNIKEFVTFSKEFTVPDNISNDKDTITAKREEIDKRKAIIAFPLNKNRDLVKWEGKNKSVYSFLPMENARSGYPFIVQSDFIVEPGRRNIDHNAAWNHWLVKKIREIAEKAIEEFQEQNEYKSWRKHYREFFNVEKRDNDKVFQELFLPHLVRPIDECLDNAKIPDINDNLIPVDKAVKASPHGTIVELIDENDLEIIYEKEGLSFMDAGVQLLDDEENEIKKIGLVDVARSKNLLKGKIDKVDWFKNLYKKLNNISDELSKEDLKEIYILTEDKEIKKAGKVYFNELPEDIEDLRKESEDVKEMLKKRPFLNTDLEGDLNDFFKEFDLVKKFRYEKLCEDVFLDKISVKSESPKPKENEYNSLVEYTALIKSANLTDENIWVLSKDNNIVSSEEILMSSDYCSDESWDKHKEKLPFEFINSKYLEHGEKEEWYDFFEKIGVNTKSDYENLATQKLLTRIRPEGGEHERSPPSREKILLFSRLIKDNCDFSDFSGKIWVITQSHPDPVPSNSIFLADIYDPLEYWEDKKDYFEKVHGIDPNFISEEYIIDKENDGEIEEWNEFFSTFGVRGKGHKKKHVGNFGESYVEEQLQDKLKNIKNVSGEDHGYDLIGEKENGEQIYIEVKGKRERKEKLDEDEIKLSKNESLTAGEKDKRENYWTFIVTNIPNEPKMYLINNPDEEGINPEIILPKDKWETYHKNINF